MSIAELKAYKLPAVTVLPQKQLNTCFSPAVLMSYKVKPANEKEISQEGTVDGKTYPPPKAQPIGTLTRKSTGSSSDSDGTDGSDESLVKCRVVLLSKSVEGWTSKLSKNHKYRVIVIQKKAANQASFELFSANEYSTTKDAFNNINKTLAPLIEDGCVYLTKDLLKQIILPEPTLPDLLGPRLVETMQKEPGVHGDWQHLIQKLTAQKMPPTTESKQESGLASLKRKFQNKKEASSSAADPRLSLSFSSLQADLAASAHLVAVPKVAKILTDDETSEEVWTLFRKGTLNRRNAEDKGKTWLIEATEKQYLQSCLKLILSHAININDKHPRSGDTALHIAVRTGNLILVKMLLAYQADPSIHNASKETPFDAVRKMEGPKAKAILNELEKIMKLKSEATCYYAQNAKLPKKRNSSDTFLLSLDGGGMRSVIMCHILTAIENRMKELSSSCKPLQSYFDYIAGTSAGAIIGGLLLYADVSVPLAGMYLYKFMFDVFCCQKTERSKKLKGYIIETVGEDKVLSEAKNGNLIVTTTLANVSPNKLHLMTSYGEARDNQLGPDDRKVWEALVASSAAPTYFPAFQSFLDGGLMSNNPTLPAMADIVLQNKKQSKKSKIGCVLSLGTGFMDPPQIVDNFEVYVPGFTKDVAKNLFQSSMGLVSLLSHFVEQTTQSNGEVIREAQAWCDSIGAPYYRLSPPLKEEIAPDIKSTEKFISLIYETEMYVLQQYSIIDNIAKFILTK